MSRATVSVLLAMWVLVGFPPPAAAADCTQPDPGRDCRADPYLIDAPAGWIWFADFSSTVEPGEPLPCGMQATNWFRFTATETREARFDTRGPNTDHGVALAAYDGGTYLGCAGSDTDLRFACVAGRTYDVQVGSESAARGTIELLYDACGPFTAPSQPDRLTLTPGPGRGEVTMTWTEPVFDGGRPRTAYVVNGGDECGGATTTLAADASTHVVSGLTEADLACVGVAAVNAVGTSSFTTGIGEPAGVTTPPLSPTAFGQPGRILVGWDAPWLDGGSPPSSYRVESAAAPEGPFEVVGTVPGTADRFRHDGRAPATTRHYRVVAVNAWGASAASDVVVATTPDVPGAPRAVTAEPHDLPLAVEVKWFPPVSNGGDPVRVYEVWRRDASGGSFTLKGTTSGQTYRDADVLPHRAYVYEVRAQNGVGAGPASAPACGRPLLLGDFVFGDACG